MTGLASIGSQNFSINSSVEPFPQKPFRITTFSKFPIYNRLFTKIFTPDKINIYHLLEYSQAISGAKFSKLLEISTLYRITSQHPKDTIQTLNSLTIPCSSSTSNINLSKQCHNHIISGVLSPYPGGLCFRHIQSMGYTFSIYMLVRCP